MTHEQIEARSETEVINILKLHGLGQVRRKKMLDYSKAKSLIFEGKFINSCIYDRQIGWICKYLKI